MVESLQPAQVRNMDHTTNAWFQFNEHTIRSDVFYNTLVTALHWVFILDLAPGIRSKLLDRQAHLAALFIKCNYFCFVLVTKFEELFRIDRGICPCDLRYVYQTFNTRKDLKECTVIFDINNFTFY